MLTYQWTLQCDEFVKTHVTGRVNHVDPGVFEHLHFKEALGYVDQAVRFRFKDEPIGYTFRIAWAKQAIAGVDLKVWVPG